VLSLRRLERSLKDIPLDSSQHMHYFSAFYLRNKTFGSFYLFACCFNRVGSNGEKMGQALRF